MHVSAPLTLVAFAASTQAFAFPQDWNFNTWLRAPASAKGVAPTPKINAAKEGPTGGARNFPAPSARGGQGGRGGRSSQGVPAPTSRLVPSAVKVPKEGATSFPDRGFPTNPGRGGKGGASRPAQIPNPIPSGIRGGGGKGTNPIPSSIPKGPVGGGSTGGCPAVWSQISQDLTGMFLSGGQCNDAARAAIRAVFHDCFPAGGCDGSLAIPEELSRSENSPMTATVNRLADLAKQRGVTVADMIVFAGSHAVVTCPGGPITKTFIGRKDATSPAPSGQLPAADVSAAEALDHFGSKGFSATDLGALIGSHSTAKQFTTDPSKAGAPEDTTPGQWDILYYQQTLAKTAPFTFVADSNLANNSEVGPVMKRFAKDKAGWDAAFAPAMAKLEMLGGNQGDMVDCTNALPRAHLRRDAKAAPVNARAI